MIGDKNLDHQDYEMSSLDPWLFMSKKERRELEAYLDTVFTNMPEPDGEEF